ncbi:Mitochondrial ATPase complex subunit atp10 [Blyttiomyces sp. JEL0837]|nr:Mitochondrial ATPase complex subunit atp10 [Blyttiomyces sp. JEL0837]
MISSNRCTGRRAAFQIQKGACRLYSSPSSSSPPPKPTPSSTSSKPKQNEQPSSTFNAPPEPPKPRAISAAVLKKFQDNILKEAERLEEARRDPEGEKATFLTKLDARLQRQIKELEDTELKKAERGERTRLGKGASNFQRKMNDFLDLDKNVAEREKLLNMAFKEGYWDDQKGERLFNSLANTVVGTNIAMSIKSTEVARKGDKLWEAPDTLKPVAQSQAIANVRGQNLLGAETDINSLIATKRLSLVTFVFTAFGEPHVKSYVEPFLKEFKDVEGVQLVQLNIEENWTKSWALKVFAPLIRWRTPKEFHGSYIIHTGDTSALRRRMGMSNRLLGWVNLVDSFGRIRWQAHGPARPHEIEALLKGSRSLLSSVGNKSTKDLI